MYLDKEWIEELAKKYGVRPKLIRDALWPTNKNKGLGYFDSTKNVTLDTLTTITDTIGCGYDELLRYPYTKGLVNGDNNQVGNVTITNDPESLHQIIAAQKQIIDHQNAEIKRMELTTREQLKVKDQQISSLGKRIDRLIELAQQGGNQ